MIEAVGMLLAAAGEKVRTMDPPTGPPTSPSLTIGGGGVITVQWSNGDTTASTQIGKSDFIGVDPSSVFTTASPGATSKNTGETDPCPYWFVRHFKNGVATAWVQASDSNDRSGCEL